MAEIESSIRPPMPVVEREIVQEKPLALRDFRSALRRRKRTALITFLVVFALGLLSNLATKPLYTATTRVLIEGKKPDVAANNPNDPIGSLFAPASTHEVDTQIELLQSTELLAKVAKRLGVDLKTVTVAARQLAKTDLAEITVTSRSKQDAEKFAATLPVVYLQDAKRDQTGEASTGLVLTRRRLAQKTAQLQKAERALRDFKAKNGVVDPVAQRTEDITASATAQANARAAVAEAASARARLADLIASRRRLPNFTSTPITTTNPEVAILRDRIAALEEDRTRLIFLYKPSSDEVRRVDVALSALRSRLASTPAVRTIVTRAPNGAAAQLDEKIADTRAQYRAAQANYDAASRSAWNLQNSLPRYNSIEMQQAQLQRAIDEGRNSVDLLSRSVEQMSIRESAAQAADAPISIVSAPAPAEQTAPRRIRSLITTLFLALLAACVAALLSDAMDDNIKSEDDARGLLGAPVLGRLARTNAQSFLITTDDDALEDYRALRAGVHRALSQCAERAFLVTSTLPEEGKTKVAANLAATMAMENRRVILVDANLRHPQLQRVFNLTSGRGLTDVLSGHSTLGEVLQSTSTPNLQVLAAGAMSSQAADLLNSPQMDELLLQLYAQADFILFDSPACLEFSDAQVLASKIEGVLYVVEVGKTSRAQARRSLELLQQAGAQILGIALNRVNPTEPEA